MLSHQWECYVNRMKDGKEFLHFDKDSAEYAASMSPNDYDLIAERRSGEVRFCDQCWKSKKKQVLAKAKIGEEDVCQDCEGKAQSNNSA